MYIFLLLLWIILILLGLVIRKSSILVMLQSLFIAGMTAMNNGNPDQWQYIVLYTQLRNNPLGNMFSGNIGLNIIFYISSFLNQYNTSLFIICCLFMILLYKAITFYTKNCSFVFSLYLISPFVIDTIQIKNMFAVIVWLYFSRYLYKFKSNHKKSDLFMYVLGVILASSIHFAFLFTVIYIAVAFINNKNVVKFSATLGGIFVLLLLVFSRIQSIVSVLASTGISTFVLLLSKFQVYGANYKIGSANARRYATIIFYIILFFVFLIIGILAKKYKQLISKKIYLLVIEISALSLMILPLMAYSMEVYRIQRDLLLIIYILFATSFDNGSVFSFDNGKAHLDSSRLFILISSLVVAAFYLYVDSIFWNYNTNFRVLFKMTSIL